MQNFYCDHRNFDSANQPLVAPIPLARLTHAIDRIVAIYRQNHSRFKIATLMKKLILRIARISGKCLNVLRRIRYFILLIMQSLNEAEYSTTHFDNIPTDVVGKKKLKKSTKPETLV